MKGHEETLRFGFRNLRSQISDLKSTLRFLIALPVRNSFV